MKLQVGERYRMRNGEIVGPMELWLKDADYSYTFNGSLWNQAGKRFLHDKPHYTDIIEHIPKEKDMNEKITIRGLEIEYEDATDGSVTMTFEQIQKAYEQMQRIKAENDIKAGDWFWDKTERCPRKAHDIDLVKVYYLMAVRQHWVGIENATKITNPTHIQALNEIYKGMK